MSNPMDDLAKLRDAIGKVGATLHLKLESCGFVPADNEMPDHVVVTFSVDPDIVLSEQERQQREIDAQFGNIIEEFDGPKPDPEITSLREQAEQMLKDDDWDQLD